MVFGDGWKKSKSSSGDGHRNVNKVSNVCASKLLVLVAGLLLKSSDKNIQKVPTKVFAEQLQTKTMKTLV